MFIPHRLSRKLYGLKLTRGQTIRLSGDTIDNTFILPVLLFWLGGLHTRTTRCYGADNDIPLLGRVTSFNFFLDSRGVDDVEVEVDDVPCRMRRLFSDSPTLNDNDGDLLFSRVWSLSGSCVCLEWFGERRFLCRHELPFPSTLFPGDYVPAAID